MSKKAKELIGCAGIGASIGMLYSYIKKKRNENKNEECEMDFAEKLIESTDRVIEEAKKTIKTHEEAIKIQQEVIEKQQELIEKYREQIKEDANIIEQFEKILSTEKL